MIVFEVCVREKREEKTQKKGKKTEYRRALIHCPFSRCEQYHWALGVGGGLGSWDEVPGTAHH